MKKPKTADKWDELVPAWKVNTVLGRIVMCQVMLAGHGLLSEAENRRVKKRIVKIANHLA